MSFLEFASYSTPTQFRNAQGAFTERQGFLLRICREPGLEWRYGEASPLPGFSQETYADIAALLVSRHAREKILEYLQGTECDFPPALCFALDSLNSEIFPKEPCLPLELNALLPADADFPRAIQKIQAQGFRVGKIKISRENRQQAIQAMHAAITENSDFSFRLDANASLTRSEFFHFCEALPEELRQKIEYIEDPFPRFWEDPQILDCPLPLAIDQDFAEFSAADLIELPQKFLYILKPSIHLGLRKLVPLLQSALAQRRKIVLSAGLESVVGLTSLRSFAYGHADRSLAHGLATAHAANIPFLQDPPYLSANPELPQESLAWLDALDWRHL